jgi:hypothetical protein
MMLRREDWLFVFESTVEDESVLNVSTMLQCSVVVIVSVVVRMYHRFPGRRFRLRTARRVVTDLPFFAILISTLRVLQFRLSPYG